MIHHEVGVPLHSQLNLERAGCSGSRLAPESRGRLVAHMCWRAPILGKHARNLVIAAGNSVKWSYLAARFLSLGGRPPA